MQLVRVKPMETMKCGMKAKETSQRETKTPPQHRGPLHQRWIITEENYWIKNLHLVPSPQIAGMP